MFHLLAGVFAGAAMFMSGLFGGHATSTPPMMHGDHMASSTESGAWHGDQGHMGSTTPDGKPMLQGIAGKVSAVSGTTLTVTGRDSFKNATTTFSVDASNAKVVKDSTKDATIANVLVGDTILVSGPVSGTNVTAKVILDGKLANHPQLQQAVDNMRGRMASSTVRDGMHMGTSTLGHGPLPPHMSSTTPSHGQGPAGGPHLEHDLHGAVQGSAQL